MTPQEATSELADLARSGLLECQIRPYWDMEDGDVNPLNDLEVQAEVRRYFAAREAMLREVSGVR